MLSNHNSSESNPPVWLGKVECGDLLVGVKEDLSMLWADAALLEESLSLTSHPGVRFGCTLLAVGVSCLVREFLI